MNRDRQKRARSRTLRQRLSAAQWFGVLSTVLAIATVAYLAYRGQDSDNPPSGWEATSITLIAASLNLLATFAFTRDGWAHPTLARSAVRRLHRALGRAAQFSQNAQHAYESDDDEQRRIALGQISVGLGVIGEDLADSVEDWFEFQERALRGLKPDGEMDP